MSPSDDAVAIKVTEPRHVPWPSLVLGWAAMVPFPVGAALAFLPGAAGILFAELTLLWGVAVITFLAGVRRGVSFRTPGGPTVSQLAMTIWLFLLGGVALLLTALSGPLGGQAAEAAAAAILAVGFASMIALDPVAAWHGEAPLFFARLRPVQMIVPSLGLAAVVLALAR